MRAGNQSKYAQELFEYGRLKSIKVIDVHTHMDNINGVSSPVCSAEDCIKLMDEQNISQIWCATHGDLFYPNSAGINNDTKEIVKKFPDRIKGYFVFNPNQKERYTEKMHEALDLPGFIGFKVLPNYHNHALDGDGYEEMLSYAESHKLIVLSHTWGKLPHNSPREVENVMRRHPDLIFIMGHSAPGECELSIKLASEYENLYLDLCDIHRHSGIVERMVNSVSADKVLFGTDLPWYDPVYAMGSVLCAHISDDDREKIFFRNAQRILNIIKK